MEHPWLNILRNGHEKWHVVEQWAQPYSTQEFWSNKYPPIGGSKGIKNTRIWYRFKILKDTLEEGMKIRIVCQYSTEYPESQIHVSSDYETFVNTIVTIESIKENVVTAYDYANNTYVWDQTTNIMTSNQKYPFMEPTTILLCDVPFTMRVNKDYYMDEEETRSMEKKNQEYDFLHSDEILEDILFTPMEVPETIECKEVDDDFIFTLDDEDGVHEFFL